jgi:7-cyano-7-deazaguanine synthase in queuosine biosynthesis
MELNQKKAAVLLSGGLDSTTVLPMVKNEGCEVYAQVVHLWTASQLGS